MGVTEERGLALARVAKTHGARRCIETGFALGLSASFLLESCLENLHDADTHGPLVTSIDPFEDAAWKNSGVLHLRSAGVGHLHRLIQQPSEYTLPELIQAGERFDLAFVDGDHRFEHVALDIFYLRRLVGPERIIVVDDMWMASVRKAVAFYLSAGLCELEPSAPDPRSAKFAVLRVVAKGDTREWDHFADF